MEIKGLEAKKKILESLKNDERIKKLNFLLIYNPSIKENEYYIHSVSKTLEKLNIPFDIKTIKTKEEAKSLITSSNKYSSILVARPLGFNNEEELFDLIPLNKDVDMLSTLAAGRLMRGDLNYLPATAKAVKLLLDYYNIDVKGKDCLVIGRSKSVGMPIALMLQKLDGTVTVAHSKTPLEVIRSNAKRSDIVVLASGQKLLRDEDLKSNSIIIDCGYDKNGQGDLNFVPTSSSYTPVPGGIGPLTTISIVLNAIYLLGC